MSSYRFFFFFNDTATTEIYTLSLHDALPISRRSISQVSSGGHNYGRHAAGDLPVRLPSEWAADRPARRTQRARSTDRKSTRLNSSHANISYAVFCLKKKNNYSLVATRYYSCT